MTKRQAKKSHGRRASEMRERMREHIDSLGMDSSAYQAWCRKHRLSDSLNKPAPSLDRERAIRRTEDAETVLVRKRKLRKPVKLIKSVCRGEMHSTETEREDLRSICERVEAYTSAGHDRETLLEVLDVLSEDGGFLVESARWGNLQYPYIDAVISVVRRKGQWIRPLREWCVRSHNREKQFSSFVRHLFARYPVPRFMDAVWFRRDQGSYRLRDWIVLIGTGGNLRLAKTPIPLTKKMVHLFLQAPRYYSVEEALRWVRSMGS
jgi:hypothetical protein